MVSIMKPTPEVNVLGKKIAAIMKKHGLITIDDGMSIQGWYRDIPER